MVAHFNQLGYTFPPHCNTTDFVCDVLAGFVKRDGDDSVRPVQEVISTIVVFWSNVYAFKSESNDSVTLSSSSQSPPSFRDRFSIFYRTLKFTYKRHRAVVFRTFSSTYGASLSFALTGALIAILFGSMLLKGDSNNFPTYTTIGSQGIIKWNMKLNSSIIVTFLNYLFRNFTIQ